MAKREQSVTTTQIAEQLQEHQIEFGVAYVDPASGFEGEVQALYFFKHGCMRVLLRGSSKTTGEPAEFTFDAPELVKVETKEPVPAGKRNGGPHELKMNTRGGPQ